MTGYRWAVHLEPDLLALQLPALPATADGRAYDALKALLAQRGFRAVAETDELDLGVANGCALTRLDTTSAELLITISGSVGASRIPLDGVDAAWLGRVVTTGQVAVLVVDSAVGDDHTTTRDALRRDVDAGGVLAALVPTAELDRA